MVLAGINITKTYESEPMGRNKKANKINLADRYAPADFFVGQTKTIG